MSKYFISCIIVLMGFLTSAQEKEEEGELQPAIPDSLIVKEKYGLRVGADLSRMAIGFFNDNYQGFEIVGDYRISKKFYIATELGNEKKTIDDDQINFIANGSYIKAGFDYNAYENWLDMENIVHVGMRYSFSTFSQTLNSYSILNRNQLFKEETLTSSGTEFSGLNAHWVEVVAGIKAEMVDNLYLGLSIRLARLVSDKKPGNFANLWIPGFNKVTENSTFGVGFNYTISYLIPLYKKAK